MAPTLLSVSHRRFLEVTFFATLELYCSTDNIFTLIFFALAQGVVHSGHEPVNDRYIRKRGCIPFQYTSHPYLILKTKADKTTFEKSIRLVLIYRFFKYR